MKIAILLHENDARRDLRCYHVFQLAEIWRRDGHAVIPVFGTREQPAADVALLHIDLSVVPSRYLDFAAGYRRCMNRSVADIRKSRFGNRGASDGDRWHGPVIVKTDMNAGGTPERINTPGWTGLARRVGDSWQRWRGDPTPRSPDQYRVYPRLADVPEALHSDRRLFIERFTPELEDGRYVTRSMVFVGHTHTTQKLVAADPLVRVDNALSLAECEPDPHIVALQRSMGFDYGKFDYVMHDGDAILIDVNKTTGAADDVRYPAIAAMRERRARGLYDWVERLG